MMQTSKKEIIWDSHQIQGQETCACYIIIISCLYSFFYFPTANHGSHNSMCMSRQSLPYLPPRPVASQSHSRDFDSGIQCTNNYATNSPNATSSSLPPYDSDNYNATPERANCTYSSVMKPPCSRASNNPRTSSESTLVNQSRGTFAHHRPGDHSTLPSYSSQTVYPGSGGSECSPYCLLNHRHSTEDPSSNTLTSAGCYTVNSSSGHSRMAIGTGTRHRESALMSSCPEMDSRSFYHVVPDDCTQPASLPESKPRFHVTDINIKGMYHTCPHLVVGMSYCFYWHYVDLYLIFGFQ